MTKQSHPHPSEIAMSRILSGLAMTLTAKIELQERVVAGRYGFEELNYQA
ncbi:MAG: hypothetical protein V1932_02285 [Chloroflexota bacterium]